MQHYDSKGSGKITGTPVSGTANVGSGGDGARMLVGAGYGLLTLLGINVL